MQDVGYRQYHSDVTLNFMLNRMSRTLGAQQLGELAAGVSGLDDWIDAALLAADNAAQRGDPGDAACYYRAAEFFMAPDHPRKTDAYERFMSGFAEAHPEVAALRRSVAFDNAELGIIDIPAVGSEKDVIVACSGFDGLIEEMYPSMQMLADQGYRVVLYEGSGQGSALRRFHLPMRFDWEAPVAAVLDALAISSCTLLGLSLGGYLAPRAAAFEQRAKRLIAWGPMFEFFDCFRPRMGNDAYAAIRQLLADKQGDVINQLLTSRMDEDATTRWSLTHGMHTCGGESPYDFFQWAQDLNLETVSEQITQDTLIIAGSRDHLVPPEQIWRQAAALTNARSIVTRTFTEYEQAAEHCQVTNPAVVVNEIVRWLEMLRARDSED